MDPDFSIIKSLIGNLAPTLKLDLRKVANNSPGANNVQKNKAKRNATQVVFNLNINGGVFQVTTKPQGANQEAPGKHTEDDYLAIFLTNGQVYSGKIEKLESLTVEKFISLKSIYYLNSNEEETN